MTTRTYRSWKPLEVGMTHGTLVRCLRFALISVAAGAFAVAAGAQTIDPTNEGFDPMRQISTQFVRPNILLVFDVSGSMAWDEISQHSVGVDTTGSWLTASWGVVGSNSCSGTGANMKCKTWTATLTVQQTHPSRMAKVKNALGNAITIITPWTPPGGTCTDSSKQWPALAAAWSGATGPTETLNNTSQTAWIYTFAWAKTTSSIVLIPVGNPFVTTGLTAQPPTVGCDCVSTPPSDLIGKSANTVNWGLEIFSGVASSCTNATLVTAPDSNDTGNVDVLEACLKPNSTSTTLGGTTYKGLFASGGTPTMGALAYASSVLTAVAGGGSVTNANGGTDGTYTSTNFPTSFLNKSFSITADSKLSCGRVYAAILVTDGLSNTCNPNGGNWAEPCSGWPCPGTGCPDGGSSGYTCPNPDPTTKTLTLTQQGKFIGEKTDALWWLTAAGRRLYTRTWVIGVSDAVGPCELNYAAYRGRTDANSPEGDAGFDYAADRYLPEGSPGNYDSQSCPSRVPPHGSYAYFATTAAALQTAFTAIIAAVGTGDYTTSAPSVTASPLLAEGLVGFVSSAAYPKWQGHLYAYDIKASCSDTSKWDCTQPCGWVDPTDSSRKSNCLWDAGEVLSIGGLNADGSRKSPNNGLTRKLYTWNPASSNAMVPIAAASATVTTLNAICGGCGITTQVADFMLGNNGSGSARTWKLGGVINSTQAVIGPALVWKQGLLQSHSDFETTYQARHPVIWVGSSDGFTHGIDSVDGAELVAVIPPEQLAKQVNLYTKYLTKPAEFVTGEPKLPDQHIYGVANSPRFADVWFSGSTEYKTLLFVTQGLGGTGLGAIDATHPFPGRDYDGDGDQTDDIERADPNYGFGIVTNPPPVQVVWSKNRSNYAHLGNTWSVPALGGSAATTWQLIMGAGFDNALATTDTPYVYRLNPVDGTSTATQTLTNQTSGAYVRNQSFADSVLWQTTAPYFQPDNLVNQGIQVDLNGQLWIFEPSNWIASRLFNLGSNQPLYYSPAVAAYPSSASPTHQLYAFASGTFYEKSPNVTGRTSTFVPALYIGVKNRSSGVSSYSGVQIRNIPKPTGQSGFLGSKTQMTAPPMIFVAKPGSTSNPFALFLLYDPEAGTCIGTSYIIRLEFTPASLGSIAVPAANVYAAGAGASAGFAIAGERVVVSRSYVGQDGRAFIQEVPNLRIPQGGLSGSISWWLELQ